MKHMFDHRCSRIHDSCSLKAYLAFLGFVLLLFLWELVAPLLWTLTV